MSNEYLGKYKKLTGFERRKIVNEEFTTRGRPTINKLENNGVVNYDHFREVFIRHRDMTCYKPAIELVESWELWNKMLAVSLRFRANVELWRQELGVLLKAEAMQVVNKLAIEEGNFQASKWIAEEGWNRRLSAGRPSKKQQEREAKELAELASEAKEEQERVLKVINGAL